MRLSIDGLGFGPTQEMVREQIDGRTTRVFPGNNAHILAVPGLLELKQVRTRGLVMEDRMIREVPLDGSERPKFLELETRCFRLIKGVDGTELLERNRWSNDGIFQIEDEFWVSGVWDEAVSPASDEIMTIPSPQQARVGVEVGGPAESITRGRRAEPKE